MREIKFRAIQKKPLDEAGWTYWSIGDLINMGLTAEIQGEHFEFDANTWSQYTGLKDKNGVEIYEGDFLRSAENDNVYHVLDILPQTRAKMVEREGVFIEGKFHYSPQAVFNDDYMSWPEVYEVIGNIYENPELLK